VTWSILQDGSSRSRCAEQKIAKSDVGAVFDRAGSPDITLI
jgi:hypothetical protein